MNIFIYSGPVHSGKTTKLMQWSISQKSIDGIFQPVVDGKRYIYQIGSRTLKLLESTTKEINEETVSIGNYKFLKSTFDWTKKILLECFNKKLNWLVIDEIGPLELDGKGLEPSITKIVNSKNKFNGNIVFIVRENLVEKFVSHYQLENKVQHFTF